MKRFWETINLLVDGDHKQSDILAYDYVNKVIVKTNRCLLTESCGDTTPEVFRDECSITGKFGDLHEKITRFIKALKLPEIDCKYVLLVLAQIQKIIEKTYSLLKSISMMKNSSINICR
ncbi:hypothetical protein WA026_020249 [Henosepilachna vigintioctopunctata]|uniref:Uncharacterized protein n=1 Tax=Henosepilachna vigintioctopunctata TaxID=420089 RepID=A0AAW1TYU3_9CUCU